jgi:hypothetical protein
MTARPAESSHCCRPGVRNVNLSDAMVMKPPSSLAPQTRWALCFSTLVVETRRDATTVEAIAKLKIRFIVAITAKQPSECVPNQCHY